MIGNHHGSHPQAHADRTGDRDQRRPRAHRRRPHPGIRLALGRHGPQEVPIAVVGPDEAADQVQSQLDEAQPDGFDVTAVADPAEAETLIKDREVYAALAVTPESVDLYTASAASPTMTRLITGIAEQMAAHMGEAAGQPVEVTTHDLVPLPSDDPNGAGLAASAFPMAMGGIVIAALISFNVRGSGRQAAAAVSRRSPSARASPRS